MENATSALVGQFITGIERKLQENSDAIAAGLKQFTDGLQAVVVALNESSAARAELYPQLRRLVKPLAKRGWFVSGYFGVSEVDALALQCESLAEVELDRAVCEMYRSSIEEHGFDLFRDYPQRAFAIKPAIDAHNRGEFALSVPLFFAQAEGISIAAIDKYIFSNAKQPGDIDGNIKAAAKERLERAANDPYDTLSIFMEIMWLPFEDPSPIAYSERDRRINQYDGLNRNTIMHGIDLTYATEENSLKAFSMLSHVGSLMHDLARPT